MTDRKPPTYRPKRGFLSERILDRTTKKSAFLRKLERAQVAAEFTETDLRIIGEHRTPAPASSSNVVHIDQARRRPRR